MLEASRRLAWLTREDEVSGLYIVPALFRWLARCQRIVGGPTFVHLRHLRPRPSPRPSVRSSTSALQEKVALQLLLQFVLLSALQFIIKAARVATLKEFETRWCRNLDRCEVTYRKFRI